MNINQRQNILNKIQQIEQLDLYEALNKSYPNEPDATKIQIGNYNATQLLSFLKRTLSQFTEELNEGLGLFLPASSNFQNDFGAVNLENDLATVHTLLTANDFNSVVAYIDKLIYYQIINGFWDKTITTRNETTLEYDKSITELRVAEEKLKSYIEQNKLLVDSFNKSIEAANTFLTTKREEFTTLTTNQQTSITLVQEFQNLLTEAKVKDTNINNIVDNQTKKFAEIETKQKEEQALFDEFTKSSGAISTELQGLVGTTTQTLSNVSSKMEEFKKLDTYLNQKKAEIQKLAGFAADSALGHSFNERQRQLTRSSNMWLFVSLGLMIGTVTWLSLIYTNNSFKPNTGNIWFDMVLYAVKSAVAFVILGFAIRQYSKERNLQEEYAFKRSVAVTINAYADQLQGEKDTDRRKMIMDTINKMFQQPRIHHETSNGIFSLRTKTVENISEKILDGVKDVISKK